MVSMLDKSFIELNSQTKSSIERSTGLSFEKILLMSAEEVDAAIEKKIGKKLKLDLNFRQSKFPFSVRGSVYLALGRFLKFDVDKKIAKI